MVWFYLIQSETHANFYITSKGPAANHLVHGVKHWIVQPPSESFFAFKPVREWYETDYASGAAGDHRVCTQFGGDVAVIPSGWGHAVVNLADSIALAYEYHD